MLEAISRQATELPRADATISAPLWPLSFEVLDSFFLDKDYNFHVTDPKDYKAPQLEINILFIQNVTGRSWTYGIHKIQLYTQNKAGRNYETTIKI